LAAAVFFLGDRLAAGFEAGFFAVDLLVEVFFLGDRLAVALDFVFVAVFLAAAAFFFGDRLAVAFAVVSSAGFFFAADFDTVFFLVAIYVAPLGDCFRFSISSVAEQGKTSMSPPSDVAKGDGPPMARRPHQ